MYVERERVMHTHTHTCYYVIFKSLNLQSTVTMKLPLRGSAT